MFNYSKKKLLNPDPGKVLDSTGSRKISESYRIQEKVAASCFSRHFEPSTFHLTATTHIAYYTVNNIVYNLIEEGMHYL